MVDLKMVRNVVDEIIRMKEKQSNSHIKVDHIMKQVIDLNYVIGS